VGSPYGSGEGGIPRTDGNQSKGEMLLRRKGGIDCVRMEDQS